MTDRKPTAAELAERFENEAILMRAQFRVFTLHPIHGLDKIVSKTELDEIVASWKAAYPDVPVYYHPVTRA